MDVRVDSLSELLHPFVSTDLSAFFYVLLAEVTSGEKKLDREVT